MEKLAEELSGSHLTRLYLDNNNITYIGAGKLLRHYLVLSWNCFGLAITILVTLGWKSWLKHYLVHISLGLTLTITILLTLGGKVGCGIAKFPAQMLTLVKNEMTKIGKIKTNLTAKFKAVKTKISL